MRFIPTIRCLGLSAALLLCEGSWRAWGTRARADACGLEEQSGILNGKTEGSLRGVEEVVGGVWNAEFLAEVRSVAAGGRCFAPFGVETLDGCYAGQHAAAIVADDVDEKPRNRLSVGRRRVGNGFAGNTAAVVRFPGRSGKMFAEEFAILVEELGVGSFQRPGELRGVTLAGVD